MTNKRFYAYIIFKIIKICPNLSTKYRERLLTRKKSQIDKVKPLEKLFTKISEASFFSFFFKKKIASSHWIKKIQSFFPFGLKDNFFFSPSHTSKKSLSTITEIPCEEQKKPCLPANTYANESVRRPPRNTFSLFYSLLKLVWLTKNIKVWRKFEWLN